MVTMADLIAAGKEFGIFQFYLPFMISFAIIYGILSKVKLFGGEKLGRNVNLIVSGVLSLFLIGYTPVGISLAEYFGSVFTGTILVVVTILGSLMILYMLGQLVGIEVPVKGAGKKWAVLLLLLAVILAVGVFASSGGLSFFPGFTLPGVTLPSFPVPVLPSLPSFTLQDIAMIMVFLGTVGLLYWMTREGKPAGK